MWETGTKNVCVAHEKKSFFFLMKLIYTREWSTTFLSRFNIKKGKIDKRSFWRFLIVKNCNSKTWKCQLWSCFSDSLWIFHIFPCPFTEDHQKPPQTHPCPSTTPKSDKFFNFLLIVFSPKMNLFSKVSVKRITSHNQRFFPSKTDIGTSFFFCPSGGAA